MLEQQLHNFCLARCYK